MALPQYVFDRRLGALLDTAAIKAAVHVDTDPPSGVALVSVYTDDGAGNGDCLFSLPLDELLRLADKLGALNA